MLFDWKGGALSDLQFVLWLIKAPFREGSCGFLGLGITPLLIGTVFFREVAIDALKVNSEMIGGVGEEVEVDKSKFGKSKLIIFSL